MKSECYLVPNPPKVVVLYCHVPGCPHHLEHGRRFVDTWLNFPPGFPGKLVVIANGSKPNGETHELFARLNPKYFEHDDSGWDIGAYQHYCRGSDDDMVVFLGGSSYLRRENWLKRMVEVFTHFEGVGLFGCCANLGVQRWGIIAHIRTTGFWCCPALMNAYPMRVTDPSQRYPFEHGHRNLTSWSMEMNVPARVVDFSGCYDYPQWNSGDQGYHQGEQRDLIVGDRMCAPPFYHHP